MGGCQLIHCTACDYCLKSSHDEVFDFDYNVVMHYTVAVKVIMTSLST